MLFFRKSLKIKFWIIFTIYLFLLMNNKSILADDVIIPKSVEIKLCVIEVTHMTSLNMISFYRVIKNDDVIKIVKLKGEMDDGMYRCDANGNYRYFKMSELLIKKYPDDFRIIKWNISVNDFIKIWKTISFFGLKDRQIDYGWNYFFSPGYITVSISNSEKTSKKASIIFSTFPESAYDLVTKGKSSLNDYSQDELHASKLLNDIENTQKNNLIEKKMPEIKSEVVSTLLMLYNSSPYTSLKDPAIDTFAFKEHIMRELEYYGVTPDGGILIINRSYLNIISYYLNDYIKKYNINYPKKASVTAEMLKEYYNINPEAFSTQQEVDAYLSEKNEDFKKELLKTYKETNSEVEKDIAAKILKEDYGIDVAKDSNN